MEYNSRLRQAERDRDKLARDREERMSPADRDKIKRDREYNPASESMRAIGMGVLIAVVFALIGLIT